MSGRVISQAVLGVLALSILGALAAGFIWGIPAFLLAMASGTLSLVIVLMWGSLQQMEESDEMEFEQALSYAAPSVEEEQKRALLRTLKDLEYELSVGKISREDYDEIYAEVAEKAKRMIALTDEAMKGRVAAAEALVSSRLANAKASKGKQKKKPSAADAPHSDPPRSGAASNDDSDPPDSSPPDSSAASNDDSDPPDSSPPDSSAASNDDSDPPDSSPPDSSAASSDDSTDDAVKETEESSAAENQAKGEKEVRS